MGQPGPFPWRVGFWKLMGNTGSIPCEMEHGLRWAHTLEARLLRSWYSPEPLHLFLTAPLRLASFVYRRGLHWDQLRARKHRKSLPVPVISVGNIVAGGTGKTPFVLWLTRFLQDHGLNPAVLSRGYGSQARTPARVVNADETAPLVEEFGDEPVLMARKASPAPVWVGKHRWICGQRAIRECGIRALVLDDGFQHLALDRDIDFVLLDARMPFGNRQLIPAGPLREPISHLCRAKAFVLTRAEDSILTEITRTWISRQFPGRPVFACKHRPVGICNGMGEIIGSLEGLQGRPAVAFAGIAHPDAFFQSLSRSGARLKACYAFPDHYRYKPADLARMFRSTRKAEADFLLTTEKDIVRLPAEVQAAVAAIPIELDFGADEAPLREYLCNTLHIQ